MNLVQLDAVVTDRKGKQVTDLAAGDFDLLQDGKPQVITNLSYVRIADPTGPAPALRPVKTPLDTVPAPPVKLAPNQVRRTIALIVDDLNLSFVNIARVRQALATFVDEQMQPGDLAAILRTSAGIGALQEFTTDKRLLHAAIDRVRWTFVRNDDGVNGIRNLDLSQEAVFAIGTLGAVRYVVNGLGQLPGRKSVVLFSDLIPGFSGPGVNSQLLESMHRLIDAANRAAAVIYAIDPAGVETLQITAQENVHRLGQPMIDKAARRAQEKFLAQAGLDFLVDQTGGLFIYNDNDLHAAIHDVLEDQAGYYLIGYQPAAGTFDPVTGRRLFHSVKLRVKRPGLTVRSRSGFFGVADSEPDPSSTKSDSREEQLAKAILSPFDSSGIGVRLTTLFVRTPMPVTANLPATQGEKRPQKAQVSDFLNVILYIDPKDLTFTAINEPVKEPAAPDGEVYTRKAVIDLLILTFGDNGQVVDSTYMTYTIRRPEKLYQQSLRDGFVYAGLLPVRKSGAYQVRVAVRDATSQHVGSASQFIQVPDASKGRLLLSSLLLSAEPGRPGPDPTRSGPDAAYDPSSALRAFKAGTQLSFAYEILNAQAGANGIQLQVQTRLFAEGRKIYEGSPEPFDAAGLQGDPKNLAARGGLSVGHRPRSGRLRAPGDRHRQLSKGFSLQNRKHVADVRARRCPCSPFGTTSLIFERVPLASLCDLDATWLFRPVKLEFR